MIKKTIAYGIDPDGKQDFFKLRVDFNTSHTDDVALYNMVEILKFFISIFPREKIKPAIRVYASALDDSNIDALRTIADLFKSFNLPYIILLKGSYNDVINNEKLYRLSNENIELWLKDSSLTEEQLSILDDIFNIGLIQYNVDSDKDASYSDKLDTDDFYNDESCLISNAGLSELRKSDEGYEGIFDITQYMSDGSKSEKKLMLVSKPFVGYSMYCNNTVRLVSSGHLRLSHCCCKRGYNFKDFIKIINNPENISSIVDYFNSDVVHCGYSNAYVHNHLGYSKVTISDKYLDLYAQLFNNGKKLKVTEPIYETLAKNAKIDAEDIYIKC